jgi:hypothetical protein
LSRTLKSELSCPPVTAAQAEPQPLEGQWREKINPLLVGGIQFFQFIMRVLNQLQLDQDLEEQTTKLFIESCKHMSQFLPEISPENSQIETGMHQLSANFGNDSFIANPEVRRAMAEIAARFANAPPDLLKKGFAQPHWWMRYPSWSEFFKTQGIAQSLLNLLSFLHFQISLDELTQRVADGDLKLYSKVFRFVGKELKSSSETSEKLLKSLDDRAMQVVGRALLFQGEPRGYQLRLRMVLFFGWDFGLVDLSNNELCTFLNEMQIIPASYDPESLRRYRNRMRALIKRSLRPALLEAPQTEKDRASSQPPNSIR